MDQRRSSTLARYVASIIVVIFFSTALLGQRTAYAQGQGEVKLTVRTGLGGYCKEKRWIPVRITVENSGPDVNARIQAAYSVAFGAESITAVDISLPTTSRKELFLYLHSQVFLNEIKVSVISENKTLADTKLKLTCVGEQNLVVGLLADKPSAYVALNEITTTAGLVRVTPLQIADLPDQVQGWDGLDALVVSGVDTGALSTGQRQAMELWLADGGKLLVVGGPNWQSAAAGLGDLIPIDLNTTKNVSSLEGLQTYFKIPAPVGGQAILSTGQPHADAEVLAEQDGLPLVVQKRIGFGKIVFLAADPALQPLSDWGGLKDVYEALLTGGSFQPPWSHRNEWARDSAEQALATLSELGIPSVFYICGWLGVYLVIVGPVNFLILRRVKRPELAWVTIPGVVLLFIGIAYVSGILFRGTRPILNRLMVVQAWEGVSQAKVHALVGTYSPTRTKYTLEAETPFLFHPFNTDEAWLSLQQGVSSSLPDIPVEIGDMKTVELEGNLPALSFSHDLAIHLSNTAPMLGGTLTNTTGKVLKQAILVTPGYMQELGDFAPGETKDIKVSLTPGANGPDFYANYGWPGTNPYNPYNRPSADGSDEIAIRRNAFFSAVLHPNYSMSQGNWGIYLMGWVDDALLPVSIRDRQTDVIDTTLYITQLTPALALDGETLELSPGLFMWDSSQPGLSPYYSNGGTSEGYVFRYKLGIPLEFDTVEALIFHMQLSSVNQNSVTAALWNFERAIWEEIEDPIGNGHTRIADPERYVGPSGEIRVKIISDPAAYNEIRSANFTLLVNP